jgi:outer membrane protein assembly factor BamB
MRTALLTCGILISSQLAFAENWPAFRGPAGDGQSAATGLPAKFGDGEHVAWKTAIHGKGWSSPVVWGQQIWMTTATEDGKKMSAVAVDLNNGKIIHDVLVFENANPRFCHPTNSYASPTPVIEEGRIYVHFGSYGTACLDSATGNMLWSRRDFECDHFRAPGGSPILFRDMLFLNFDGVDQQYVVALNKKTGKTAWRKERTIDYGTDNGDRKKAYSTPTVIEYKGRAALVSPAAVATIAYSPLTGDELWRVRHGGMNAAPRPLFANGLIYLAAGGGKTQFVAVRPGGNGDVTESHIAWSSGVGIPRRGSQLLVDNSLYMVADNGVASCRDAKSGKIIWQHRFGGDFWASPVAADGKIYFFSKQGKVFVVAASREFKQLAENEFDAGFNSSAAIVDNSLIIRNFTHLYRIKK